MTFAIHEGVWPVMITPWKEDNTPDFKALEALTNWYVEKGCDGIFAVFQSSEMHYLSAQEKLDIARCVSEAAAGRLQIVASGNTECSRTEQYRQIEDMMKIPGIGAFRTLTFIPVITSMVAVSLIWSMLYEDNGGLLNTLLGYVGLPPVHWLTDTNMAMISIAIMSIWKGLGYNMTIFLAGLQGVPHDLYEAATIDGANSVQKFFKITVPMIGPTTYFVTLMSLIGSLQVFDQVYIMTNGGPVNATKTVAMYLYQYGFQFYKMGYACAAAYVLFILVFIVSLIQNRSSKNWAESSI